MKALRFLTDLHGRASRKAMAFVTVMFVTVSLIHSQMLAAGSQAIATGAFILQLALIWPALIALPYRRFHDMGRRGYWVFVFWGGALLGLVSTHWGLSQTGRLVDMSAVDIWQNTELYTARIAELNAGLPAERAIKLLNGPGMGGISLAMIFLLIQFGWLHFIPGQPGGNRFGTVPGPSTIMR